jgi:2-isopropylmalate synthase
MMINNPSSKYTPQNPIELSNRQWPNKRITKAPIWMSTDLRDGNQSLIEPMNIEKKLRMFKQLVQIGFKEIEVSFPSASAADFNFVRKLIEDDLIPDDVTIEVLTQSREHLIRRTIESLIGAKRAIVHLYNPTAPIFREVVYRKSKQEIINLAVEGTQLVKSLVADHPETEWIYQYSPEAFSMTELDYCKEVCDAVTQTWQPTPEHKMILNLPATVESGTPNIYADQIEWMHTNLERRDSVLISVHPHNDRGTAVAATELAIMAGADRVEGCLFASGERTGNVDLVTLGLNLYTQGISPELDFSKMDDIQECAEYCTQLPVHPRHPYCGELVFTAFSGSHQDAIKKGLSHQQSDQIWEVPYLPLDPQDIGRNYDAVIRVNSQSGKGGITYMLQHDYGIDMPRKAQIEFSSVVQTHMDAKGEEISSKEIFDIFTNEYINASGPYKYLSHKVRDEGTSDATQNNVSLEIDIEVDGVAMTYAGNGNGPLDAAINALASDIDITSFQEYSLDSGSTAEAICFIEVRHQGQHKLFGSGRDTNITSASLKSLISGMNRLHTQHQFELKVQLHQINKLHEVNQKAS